MTDLSHINTDPAYVAKLEAALATLTAAANTKQDIHLPAGIKHPRGNSRAMLNALMTADGKPQPTDALHILLYGHDQQKVAGVSIIKVTISNLRRLVTPPVAILNDRELGYYIPAEDIAKLRGEIPW